MRLRVPFVLGFAGGFLVAALLFYDWETQQRERDAMLGLPDEAFSALRMQVENGGRGTLPLRLEVRDMDGRVPFRNDFSLPPGQQVERSTVALPPGEYQVELSGRDGVVARQYIRTDACFGGGHLVRFVVANGPARTESSCW